MKTPKRRTFKKAVLLRMRFIDAMLSVHGYAGRKFLRLVFEVESATASNDLAAYAAMNDSIRFNHTNKCWEPIDQFRPVEGLLSIPPAEYMELVGRLFGVEFIPAPVINVTGIKKVTV